MSTASQNATRWLHIRFRTAELSNHGIIIRSNRTRNPPQSFPRAGVARSDKRGGVWRLVRRRAQGKSFAAGKRVQGQITYPGYEHLVFEIEIERMEPERLVSWRWYPGAIDAAVDYSKESTTLVEFELEDAEGGTLLTVRESGFDKLPPERRLEAFRLNNSGWDEQLGNIERNVATP